MLAVVLWAFTRLQIGVSRAGALQSGMAAIPVFLLWAHASWLVILLGAQIAIAHELDGILIHGTSALSLDPYGEQMAGLQIMVETTRRALSSPDDTPVDDGRGGTATANELARELRLLPDTSARSPGGYRRRACFARPNRACIAWRAIPTRRACATSSARSSAARPTNRRCAPRRPGPSLHELVARRATANGK